MNFSNSKKYLSIIALSALLGSLSAFTTGCNSKYIDNVIVGADTIKNTLGLTLVFDKGINFAYSGSYQIKEYGNVFVTPSTSDSPFTVGFNLNMGIVNDSDYAKLTPTNVLPTGQALPGEIKRALYQLTVSKLANSKFDIYTYIDIPSDIKQTEWLGLAMTLNFPDEKNFPSGLSITQQFLLDKTTGSPGIIAMVYGPTLDDTGNVKTPAGIAFFANAKQLSKKANPTFLISDKGEMPVVMYYGKVIKPETLR